MYFVVVKKTESSKWEFYCSADTFDEARRDIRDAVENDGYKEAEIWSRKEYIEYFG